MTAQHWLWVSLALNLVLAVTAFLVLGWGQTYRAANHLLQRRVAILTDPSPTCGCTHHYSFHNEEGCHYTVVHYKDGFRGMKGVISTCPCVRYAGPEPLPRYTTNDPPEGDEPA